jgi:hypothetical protein
MIRRTALYLILFLFSSSSLIFAQTAIDLQDKYGPPTQAYSVSEHIWMTPKFAANGQPCSMRLYPKRISSNMNYLLDTLDYGELRTVLGRLAPPESRGKRSEGFGLTSLVGQSGGTLYPYDNVTFTFLFSLSRPSALQTTVEKNLGDDMPVLRGAEIVAIVWRKRTCAEP